MLQLGLAHQTGPLTVREMAAQECVSARYLEKLIAALKGAGLVLSFRGPHGGYVLARTPSEIKLSEVVEALQGPLSLVKCVDHPEVCPRREICVTYDIWKEMKDAMVGVLNSQTLQDLIERRRQKEESGGLRKGV